MGGGGGAGVSDFFYCESNFKIFKIKKRTNLFFFRGGWMGVGGGGG